MYNEETLCKIPFFKNMNITNVYDEILDSLTKVVQRKHIFNYINYLIENNTIFSLIMLDLDNFKLINDNYGHSNGDKVLVEIADKLVEYVGDRGIVGRFGGDEFIIVYLSEGTYDDTYKFIHSIYGEESVLRRTIKLDSISPMITGTMGSASYPKDASNFDELFEKVDKALYRGKMKGRNCFIVYVHEKHKDIDISKPIRIPMYHAYTQIYNIISSKLPLKERIIKLSEFINSYLSTNFQVTINNKVIYSPILNTPVFSNKIYDLLDVYGLYYNNSLYCIKRDSKELYDFFINNKILSVLLCAIKDENGNIYGYLAFYENKIERIWQEEDMSLMIYISNLLNAYK